MRPEDNKGQLLLDLSKVLKDIADAAQRQQEAEQARRASLTAEQRAAEDRAEAARIEQAKRQKIISKLSKCMDAIRHHETWTIDRFAWLLAAENPDDPRTWGFLGERDNNAEQEHKTFSAILASCVDVSLKPVNRADTRKEWRFRIEALMEGAKAKRLGCFSLLAELREDRQDVPAAKPPAGLAKKGTISRERLRIQRRTALVETAREVAASGKGTIYPTRIVLSLRGIELNDLFRAKHPEWVDIADKTLEADRTAVKPRIEVMTGRPRKNGAGKSP